MKKNFWLSALVGLTLILSACAAAATPQPDMAPPMEADYAGVRVAGLSAGVPDENSGAGSTSGGQAPVPNRLVIKNASLVIIVDDPVTAMTTIANMAGKMEGYVVSSRTYKTRTSGGIEVPQANISVRVASERLDEAIAQIKGLTKNPAEDVTSENVTGKDVTADYVDLKARLTNLENTEKKLQQIQDAATKTEDVLAVFNRLSEVRQQIEQVKGQIKYYEESAALSALDVQIMAKAGIAPVSVGGWQPVGVARDAFQALIEIGKFLVEVLIWLVIVFLPLGLVLYFPGRWLWRLGRKIFPRNPAKTLPPNA